MLLPVASRSAKGSRITMGTRGSTGEMLLGGVTSITESPDQAETQPVDQLYGPPIQESGTAGPGSVQLGLILDEGSKAYEELYDRFAGTKSNTGTFNMYKGESDEVYYDSTARVEIATANGVSQATFSVIEIQKLPIGTADEWGEVAVGHVIQYVTGGAMYRIDALSDQLYVAATKMQVTPLNGADPAHSAGEYRIVKTILVKENWQAGVTLAGDASTDATSPVVQGNVTISPKTLLPKAKHIPYSA